MELYFASYIILVHLIIALIQCDIEINERDSVVIEDPFETNEHYGNFINPSDSFRNRIERQEPNTNTKVAEGSKGETGEPGSSGAKESVSSKEITNEDIVRRRKLEKERFGEAQYVDYPEEESKKKKKKKAEETPEEKAKKEEKKNRKKARRTVEFLEGLAEIGLGVVLFGKVGQELSEGAEAAGGEG